MSTSRAVMLAPGASAPSTSKKHARATESPDSSGEKSRRKRKKETSKERRDRKKKSLYHLRDDEVPKDAKGYKRAFERHIHLLAGLHTQEAIMPSPSPQNLARFDERFQNSEAVRGARTGAPLLARNLMLDISTLRGSDSTSNISRELARLEDSQLEQIALQLSRFGLSAWCPNYAESPYSLYNQAIRFIAIDTFKHAATAGAYVSMKPNLSYIHNIETTVEIFDNCVFEHHLTRFEKERSNPGSVAAAIDMTNMYKRRARLARERGEYLRTAGFPLRAVALVEEPECASDDEEDVDNAGHKIYRVKSKRYRSSRIHELVKWIDKCRLVVLAAKGQRKRGREERRRVRSDSNDPTAAPEMVTTFPTNVPLDYFDPDVFNDLPIAIRARYAENPRIGIPADNDEVIKSPARWKGLSDREFMAQYGDDILKAYHLPTDEEMDNIAANEHIRVGVPSAEEQARAEFMAAFGVSPEPKKGKRAKAARAAKGKGKGKATDDMDTSSEGSGGGWT